MEIVTFLPVLIILGAFLFFSSRRQKKAMQATIDLHDSLCVGDLIHTTSGMQATIAGIDDDYIDLEIAPGVITRWMKLAIRDRVDPAEDELEGTDDEFEANEDAGPTEITRSTGSADGNPDRI